MPNKMKWTRRAAIIAKQKSKAKYKNMFGFMHRYDENLKKWVRVEND